MSARFRVARGAGLSPRLKDLSLGVAVRRELVVDERCWEVKDEVGDKTADEFSGHGVGPFPTDPPPAQR